jgi:hypothetical protein
MRRRSRFGLYQESKFATTADLECSRWVDAALSPRPSPTEGEGELFDRDRPLCDHVLMDGGFLRLRTVRL